MEQPAPLSAEALLLSDEYWHADGVIDPPEAALPHLRADMDGVSARISLRDCSEAIFNYEKGEEIGRLVLSMSAGGTRDKLEAGEVIELPEEHPRQVIKIVEEKRLLVPKMMFGWHPAYKMERKLRDTVRKTAATIPNYFENKAADILSSDIPLGIGAVAYVPYDKKYIARISRDVYYARGNNSPYYGACVYAPMIMLADAPATEPIATGRIVNRTVEGKRRYGESLSKIAIAEVLEPTGIIWTNDYNNPNNMQRKRQPKQKRVWLPTLAPGMAPGLS